MAHYYHRVKKSYLSNTGYNAINIKTIFDKKKTLEGLLIKKSKIIVSNYRGFLINPVKMTEKIPIFAGGNTLPHDVLPKENNLEPAGPL